MTIAQTDHLCTKTSTTSKVQINLSLLHSLKELTELQIPSTLRLNVFQLQLEMTIRKMAKCRWCHLVNVSLCKTQGKKNKRSLEITQGLTRSTTIKMFNNHCSPTAVPALNAQTSVALEALLNATKHTLCCLSCGLKRRSRLNHLYTRAQTTHGKQSLLSSSYICHKVRWMLFLKTWIKTSRIYSTNKTHQEMAKYHAKCVS